MSRLAWTDPAPLEVERPRLPWWTMLSRKLLLAASPIIAVVVVVMVLVFVARRIRRYPLFLVGGTLLIGLGLSCSWWVSVELVAAVAVLCGLWGWAHPESFSRTVVRQVRSEWRRAVVYAWRWRRVMLFSELTKRTGASLHRVYYPMIRRVRADGWRDRVCSRCCTVSAPRPTQLTPMSWRTPSVPGPAVCGWIDRGGSGWTWCTLIHSLSP